MAFPSPVAFWILGWPVHWYGLSYGVGILLAWFYCRFWVLRFFPNISLKNADDAITWGILGIVIGGRIGHILFYYPSYYLAHPMQILHVWRGGMSFHGGLLGVMLAFFFYCRKHQVPFLSFCDFWACGAPIGLFFGRLANFVNQELYGRLTTSPWGIVFPKVGPFARHPSQLYEAGLEGIMLFLIMWGLLSHTRSARSPGMLSGVFLIGYGIFRWISEYFRDPLDTMVGDFVTMGQLYCLPFVVIGIGFLVFARKNAKAAS